LPNDQGFFTAYVQKTDIVNGSSNILWILKAEHVLQMYRKDDDFYKQTRLVQLMLRQNMDQYVMVRAQRVSQGVRVRDQIDGAECGPGYPSYVKIKDFDLVGTHGDGFTPAMPPA
jgi:hypothetical protein